MVNHTYPGGCFVYLADDILTPVNRILLLAVFSFLFVSIVTTNMYMIVSLWMTNHKFQLWQKLLFFLCLIDTWTGFVTIPIQIFMVSKGSNATCFQLAVQGFTNGLTPMLSCITLTLLAGVRYFNITNDSLGKRIEAKWVIFLLSLAALLSLAVALWHSLNTQSTNNDMQGYFYLTVGVLVLLFLIITVILNYHLLQYIRHTTVKTFRVSRGRRQTNVTKTIAMMSIASVFCILPSGIAWMVSGTFLISAHKSYRSLRLLNPWLHTLTVANSGINSLIYLINTRKHAYFVKNRRRSEAETNGGS